MSFVYDTFLLKIPETFVKNNKNLQMIWVHLVLQTYLRLNKTKSSRALQEWRHRTWVRSVVSQEVSAKMASSG